MGLKTGRPITPGSTKSLKLSDYRQRLICLERRSGGLDHRGNSGRQNHGLLPIAASAARLERFATCAPSMKTKFQFSRMDMTMLVVNTVVFGGCLVLLLLGRASVPLILLSVGAFGMLVGKLGRAYSRARQSESSLPRAEKR